MLDVMAEVGCSWCGVVFNDFDALAKHLAFRVSRPQLCPPWYDHLIAEERELNHWLGNAYDMVIEELQ